MKIAIIGSGISGLVSAHLLHEDNEISVFEADDRVGGHSNTVEVESAGETYAIDTGFIVFNDWTYPNFIKLLDKLGIASQDSEMSFSVSCEKTGLEYCGSSINALFAQRSNLLRVPFYRMLMDIIRFNRHAKSFLKYKDYSTTMCEFLALQKYSNQFVERYIIPMMAAIWSAKPFDVEDFPARHFLRFFENHGLLNLTERPQWRSISGGSQSYVGKITEPFRDRIRLSSPIEAIRREEGRVLVRPRGGEAEAFDHVVIAAHSDQALRMLDDPTEAERDILGSIEYQENEATLHTDEALLPRNGRAWASWNYNLPKGEDSRATLTYHMNTLQSLDAPVEFCVTLNGADRIAPEKVLRRITYHHPIFSSQSVDAQARHSEISGPNRTHYCGAYWGYGFHEDGVRSALQACSWFGKEI